MYLKITNTGTVSRKFFELIGASDKRDRMDDPDVIGNKGSGAKLAIVPTLRLDLEVAVTSTDSVGPYVLRYITKPVELGKTGTVNQIYFKYDGDGEFPSQLTTEAFRDWDKPIGDDQVKIFKALREYLVNAWDEDKDFSISEVESIHQSEPGTTSVFITITDEVRHVLNHLERYFKFLKDVEPILDGKIARYGGKIYPKSESGVTRLFSQGVLVDCKKSSWHTSIFDYSLDYKYLLSEERIIKDYAEFVEGIGCLLMKIREPKLVIQLFQAMVMRDNAELELDAIVKIRHPNDESIKAFRLAWELHFGIQAKNGKAVIAVNNTQIDCDAEYKGYYVVRNLPHELQTFLKRCGIRVASDVVAVQKKEKEEKPAFELIELDSNQQAMFDEAYKIFLHYHPDAAKLPVYFYKALEWPMTDNLGHCGIENRKYKELWLEKSAFESVETVLKVLNHEFRHCKSKANDYSRDFTMEADKFETKLMMANPEPVDKNIWKAIEAEKRGLSIPGRFAGQQVFVLVTRNLIQLIIGSGKSQCTMSAILDRPITGHYSKQRQVAKYRRNIATVFLPPKILSQVVAQSPFVQFEIKH